MTTRKFNSFEYTGQSGSPDPGGLHREVMFETPRGFAFVIAASAGEGEQEAARTATALERVRYYLENEAEEAIEALPGNALMYTSGYLYQAYQKGNETHFPPLSCLCVLFREGEVYYSWVGDICLFLFNGKKMFSLAPVDKVAREDGANLSYMGEAPLIEPQSPAEPLRPLNQDMLLAGSGSSCDLLCLKQTRKILQDSMPSQTKLARLMHLFDGEREKQPLAIQMLRFYNLDNRERRFVAGRERVVQKTAPIAQKENMTKRKSEKKDRKKDAGADIKQKTTYILYLAGLLVVGYMFYDLFLNDPRPPVNVPLVVETGEAAIESPEDTLSLALDEPPSLPEDIPYMVRGGDTWGRIYTQFGVCSWFIINHPPNTGRFGRDGTLIADVRLQIPVRYSGDPDLNPHYHAEFSPGVVGSSCENAGPELLENFQEMIQSQ